MGGGYGHFGGHSHHTSFYYLGSPFFWSSYGYWPYTSYPSYYSPDMTLILPPLRYIDKNVKPKIQPLEPDTWDYCAESNGYYPYVKACPGGWRKIDMQPVGQASGYWYYCGKPAGYYPYVRTCAISWQKIVP